MTPEDKLADAAYTNARATLDAADKVAAAIDRNTEQLKSIKGEVGSLGCVALLIWLTIGIVGCGIAAKAAPITSTPGDPCATGPCQPWYTASIPTDGGVYPMEVFAPALPRLWSGPQIVELGEPPRLEPPNMQTPEPGTGWMMISLGLLAIAWAIYPRRNKE